MLMGVGTKNMATRQLTSVTSNDIHPINTTPQCNVLKVIHSIKENSTNSNLIFSDFL